MIKGPLWPSRSTAVFLATVMCALIGAVTVMVALAL